ncbi:MAG: hypothetical protein WBN66_04685 [Smithella sp.]
MATNIEKRIETLETIKRDEHSALPLINFKWTGPELSELTFMLENGKLIERLPGESDNDYRARSLEICRVSHRGQTMPTLQSNEAYIIER